MSETVKPDPIPAWKAIDDEPFGDLDAQWPSLSEHGEAGADEYEVYDGTIVTFLGDANGPGAVVVSSAERPVPGSAPEVTEAYVGTPVAERLVDECSLGAGGTSTVRQALDTIVLRRVAVKKLHPQLANTPEWCTRFSEEIRITGQLEHPNIVPLHDVGLRADNRPEYFTMKLVSGKTLKQIVQTTSIRKRGALELLRQVEVLLKVCDAVAFAHSRGVVHRDLKPDNIMVGSYGQVYVMDWGLAIVVPGASAARERGATTDRVVLRLGSSAGNPDMPGIVAGTVAFMAPEQAKAQLDEIGPRTDVFGVGAVLYYVLTHCAPYDGQTNEQLVPKAQKCKAVPPQERVGGTVRLPPELCRIAMKAMAKEPAERYESVSLLRADLERALRGGMWLRSIDFAPGAIIVREGDPGTTAYIIRKGECEVYRWEEGRRVVLRRMGHGEVFGETAVITEKPRTATVVALTEVTVQELTAEALARELAVSPSVAAVVRTLAERFRDVDAKLAQALRHGVATKDS